MDKRRTRVWMVAPILLLVASLALLFLPRPDEFGWIRKYTATELVETVNGVEEHKFHFNDGFPAGLLDDVAKRPIRPIFVQLDGGFGMGTSSLSVNRQEHIVTLRRKVEGNWLVERWEGLKQALGFRSSRPITAVRSR